MKKNKHSKPYSKDGQIPQLSIVPGVVVIAVIMAAVFSVLFIVLWRSDNVTLYFAGIFTSSPGVSEDGLLSDGDVRLPDETEIVLSGDQFHTPDFSAAVRSRGKMAELLRTIRRSDRFEQTFWISYKSGEPELMTLMRNGNQYRIESSDVLIVCDGSIVYMRRSIDGFPLFENRWNVGDGRFSAENEIGIPALEEIISWVEQSVGVPRMTFDERRKNITLTDIKEEEQVRSVMLTYETGMLLEASAETTDGELLYRCESVFYTLEPDFSDDTFRIPMS